MKLAKNYAPELVRTAYLPIAATVIAVFFSTTPVSAQTLVSGVYRTDVTWTIAGHPYVITSSLAVAAGATLTIQPGVVVKFGKSDSLDRLNVCGYDPISWTG